MACNTMLILLLLLLLYTTCFGLYPLPTKCLEVATCNQETIKIVFHPIAVNNK